jgi:ubiquitin carboxyl-terminal hydrolase 36/42
VHSIEDALRLFMTSEKLDDFRDEGTQQNLIATKQNNVERLPRILTLHLKRFAYTPFGTIEKVQKQISVSPILKFQPSWLVHEKKYSPSERTYKLYSVISHWGQRAIGGHYTCDILQSSGEWMTFDDSSVSKTSQDEVMNKPAYLLMYIRSD